MLFQIAIKTLPLATKYFRLKINIWFDFDDELNIGDQIQPLFRGIDDERLQFKYNSFAFTIGEQSRHFLEGGQKTNFYAIGDLNREGQVGSLA